MLATNGGDLTVTGFVNVPFTVDGGERTAVPRPARHGDLNDASLIVRLDGGCIIPSAKYPRGSEAFFPAAVADWKAAMRSRLLNPFLVSTQVLRRHKP